MSIVYKEQIYQSEMSKCLNAGYDIVLQNDGCRNVIEDHIPYLKQRAKIHRVDPMKSYQFKYDLYSYLFSCNIPTQDHWVILRMNDMTYPWEFDETTEYLLIPETEDLDEIVGQWSALR